jgi:SAM-dependent methyltransferase
VTIGLLWHGAPRRALVRRLNRARDAIHKEDSLSLYAIKRYTIKVVPWIWPIVSRARYLPGLYWTWKRSFPGSAVHWERHYEHGGNSGPGSYGESASYKARLINEFIREHGIRSIVEFGCGDGNQLALIEIEEYVGLDVSRNAVERCVARHGDAPKRSFIWYDQNYFHSPQQVVSADCAMSDVVFHLIEDDVFARYIRNLFCCARRFVIIYGLDRDDVQRGHVSVRYRKYSDYIAQNISDFRVVEHAPRTDQFEDFYLYERIPAIRPQSAA